MTDPLAVVHDVADLRQILGGWRKAGERIVLVPTMGALHAGHISLVQKAKTLGTRVVMSIFVNPTQFAAGEDLAAYPRSLAEDIGKFAEADGDLIFAPDVETMYPRGFSAKVSLGGPAAAGLEDRFRPTHFDGVATVVAKLFNLFAPDTAIFGEKDYQQLKVLTALSRDLDFGVEVVGGETLRESDGLALSSRNIYLSTFERQNAPALQQALVQAKEAIGAGQPIEAALVEARSLAEAAGFEIDYLEARHAETLAPVSGAAGEPIRLLAAARLGKTRLIDNLAV